MLKRNCNSPCNGYEAMYNYEGNFIKKIELAKDMPNYEVLERKAQECLNYHTGCGLPAILARSDMNRIIKMTDEQFLKAAKTFLARRTKLQ